jgi:hypothetical protein
MSPIKEDSKYIDAVTATMQDVVPESIGGLSVNVQAMSAVDDVSDNNQDMDANDKDSVIIQATSTTSATDDVSKNSQTSSAIDDESNQ